MTDEAKKLVEDNINLAYAVANKHRNLLASLYEYDDVVAMCFEALAIAANTYNISKQVKFSTYAYNVMRNNLLSIYNWQRKKRQNVIITSLDEPQTDDKETLQSVIPDNINLELGILNNETIVELYSYIEELPEELAIIVKLHLKNMSFENIARQINKSSPYTYTQYQKALNILRFKFRKDGKYE